MTFAERLACLALAALLPAAAAVAQDTAVEFRLVAAPNNITDCIVADPQFTRVHTFTVKGGQAELTAPGGVTTSMKLEKPGIYATDYQLGHFDMRAVADFGARTRTGSARKLCGNVTATT